MSYLTLPDRCRKVLVRGEIATPSAAAVAGSAPAAAPALGDSSAESGELPQAREANITGDTIAKRRHRRAIETLLGSRSHTLSLKSVIPTCNVTSQWIFGRRRLRL